MKKPIRFILFAIIDIAVLIVVLLGIYTVAEYNPKEIEQIDFILPADATAEVKTLYTAYDNAESLTLISWNIGYGSLGAKQDFFMDGGEIVRPAEKSQVEDNLTGIADFINHADADFWFIQEIDEDSKRSFNINQREFISDAIELGSAFAYNFKCFYVPYPIPPIGKVLGGLATFSEYVPESSQRIAFPSSFSWPIRTANLKRCMLASRINLGEGKGELVLVNVHLEAYDDGEGKIIQTKILTDFLREEYAKGNYVIAGGDFNQNFPTQTPGRYPTYEGTWQPGTLENTMLPGDGWQFASDDNTPTCRLADAPYEIALQNEEAKNSWQYYVIDGFIVSPNVHIDSIITVNEDFKYSDHNPVKLEFTLIQE